MYPKTYFGGRNSLLLVAIIYFTSIGESNVTGLRRRTRCFYKLCWKCDLYVDGRHKRSIPDDVNLLDNMDVPIRGTSRRSTWNIRDMQDMKSVLVDNLMNEPQSKKRFNSEQIEQRLLDEEGGEEIISDEVDVEKSVGDDMVANHARSYTRKRSVRSHFSRCLYILNTRCCKRFLGTTTYIGYKVKRT